MEYEEVTKLFRQIDDEKSPEFSKYLGLVKKFVVDSNAMGQEKGLEATLAYIENYALAGKTVSEVMSGVVAKCVAAPKARTRELALQVTLMYIEIEKYEAVQEELIKGMEQKNPKIVTACINACTTALREFGSKIISIKPLLKKISVLFADRDKGVRDEARHMVVEMYRWIGAALRPQLQAANLQPVQITELEAEFAKIEGQKTTPIRYIRSQQEKQAKIAAETVEDEGAEDEEIDDAPQDIDAYELADPVDILSKLPKDFYDKIEAKKWQDRKDVLEILENLLKTPKLENGDYGEVVRALKKVVQKDSNVICVASAGRSIASLAAGLKKEIPNVRSLLCICFIGEVQRKKQNVVIALRDAIDAVYATTTFEAILEDVVEALNNKNPSVKTETSLFLARAFTKTVPTAMNKKLLKAITAALTKTINEPDPSVRESSAEAIGTLMKLVGEKAIGPFLVELEKDNLKMSKIKENCEKAVISVKAPGVKKERPTTAPAKVADTKSAPAMKAAPRKTTAVKKKSEISSGSATVVRSKGGKMATKSSISNIEKELSDEEVDEIISGMLDASIIGDIASANWKSRLSATEQIMTEIQTLDSKSVPTQALVKFLAKKPGLKDTNFQVLKAKLDIVKYLAENCTFSITTANCCVIEISEKFSDIKNGAAAAETLTAIAEATTFGQISASVMDFAFTQKSPKVQQETLVWLSTAMKEFGFANLNAKLLIDNCKKALASINPGVRQAAITLLGTMYLYMGASLNVFFENEKPALRDQINAECDKYEGEKPPPPIRGVIKSASSNSLDTVEDDSAAEPEAVNIQDLIPRVDISSQITEALLTELTDKNWKVRNEALGKINTVIQEAKFIKSNLGDLPQALAVRLTDSNVKTAQSALNVCEAITKAMGAPWLGDSKSTVRAASMNTINAFAEQCGCREFFENEMIADALKSGSPALRIELWNWLAEKIPKVPPKTIPREELVGCVPHLYSNLEDRNADVRKNAQEAILGIMIHLGYESMVKQTEKLKPGSKTVIMAALEKVRPNLPAKPLPKKQSPPEREEKQLRGQLASKSAPPSSRKKDDDVDTSPLLVINNLKHQRTIDESKLKVLKWNFTQPREEFVDLLKDQMTTANVNKTLMSNMFHSDFRYHIKAIESLNEDLADNGQALISNLDLILKWLTLRFFDTNPSVLLKGLEYLHSVFNMLIETEYHMLENEASSFMPYLVQKIGDPKDSVRNGVKALLNLISRVYPVSKLFTYVMEGVKSKNARQRAECLEVMGSIIEDFGITVCMPSPAACLKEVAKQISDRDNSVRNAALNCVVQAYNIVGEKVYKMVGNISDKDMSLLEERIKRSSRKTISKPKQEFNATITTMPISPQKENSSPNRSNHSNHSSHNHSDHSEQMQEDEIEEEESLPPVTLPPQIIQEPPKEIEGPFKLDPEFMRELDSFKPHYSKPKLLEFDLDFLKDDVKIPSISDAKSNEAMSRMSINVHNMPVPKVQDPTLERLIKQMGSTNFTATLVAIAQLHEIIPQPRGNLMAEYENDFMNSIIIQLKFLQTQDPTVDGTVALVKLMNECITNDSSTRHVDLVMKCLWRVIKLMPNWVDEIDYDSVLLEVHHFLKKIPFIMVEVKGKKVGDRAQDNFDYTSLSSDRDPTKGPEYWKQRLDMWNVMFENVKTGKKTTATE
ncbi:hypothetical protein NQ314_003261 [Rhamnusium bicolor]|uniref:TOG domain-containing protein n=1 Tax=Rhamnusium bicolor TaxID=1586634 RepID=A0AAV8ZPN3_9CUCU|nr:hypothetical protein NQ314_003261 [Rhamnusium bicolor]